MRSAKTGKRVALLAITAVLVFCLSYFCFFAKSNTKDKAAVLYEGMSDGNIALTVVCVIVALALARIFYFIFTVWNLIRYIPCLGFQSTKWPTVRV